MEKTDLQGKAEIIISKQRNGPIGRINLAFLKNCTRFETMVEGGLPPQEASQLLQAFL
jgi:replicative DNA helicase